MKSLNLDKKKVATTIIALLALLLVAAGMTYAWTDYKQHKSNDFNGKGMKYEARLVEDFVEVDDWKVDDGDITKKISVTNLGQSAAGFGNVYVRLQLKEYMEIGKVTTVETEKRYMIDTEGRFIYYATEDQAKAAVAQGGKYEGHAYMLLTDAVTGTTGYFIQTQDHDPNGQMGKHVISDITALDPVKVIASGPDRATSTNHHGTIQNIGGTTAFVTHSEECDYAIHSFMPGADLETREYIEWRLGADVITLSEWLDPTGQYKGMPVARWIIDNSVANGSQGWVYWGQPLAPDGDVTSLLLDSVRLIKQPDGSFYYVVHTDMEAVSPDEIRNGNVDWGQIGAAFAQQGNSGSTITGILVSPPGHFTWIPQVSAGATQQFNAYDTLTLRSLQNDVIWEVIGNNSAGTHISAGGLLTVASNESVDQIRVLATSVTDNSKYSGTYVQINYPLSGVTVDPPGPVQIAAGGMMQFTGILNSTGTSRGIFFTIIGNKSNDTGISYSGLLHIAADEPVGTITVRATYIYSTAYKDVTVNVVSSNGLAYSTGDILVVVKHDYSHVNLYEGTHPISYELSLSDPLFGGQFNNMGIARIYDLTAMLIYDSADYVVNPIIDTRDPESVSQYEKTVGFCQILHIVLENPGEENVLEMIRQLEQLDFVKAAEPNYYMQVKGDV